MERTITAGGKPYKIRASAAALIIYKAQFGVDYIEELQNVGNDNEKAYIIGCRLLWAMARSAAEQLPTPDEWINMISPEEITDALLMSTEMFRHSLLAYESSSASKGEPFTAEKFRAMAALCSLSYEDLNVMPLGMALNTIENYMDIRYGDGDYVSAADFFGEG